MSILAKLYRSLLKISGVQAESDLRGIYLNRFFSWRVACKIEIDAFLMNLCQLLPRGSIMCVEGTSFSQPVIDFFESYKSSTKVKVQLSIGWPKSRVFHIPLDSNIMEEYAILSKTNAMPELLDHIYIYNGTAVLCNYQHAFLPDGYLALSKDLDESKIKLFSKALSINFVDEEALFFKYIEDLGYSRKEILERLTQVEKDCILNFHLLPKLFESLGVCRRTTAFTSPKNPNFPKIKLAILFVAQVTHNRPP